MVGIHFWQEDRPKIPAMLVLTGPQYTYKSSWAEWLIPHDMMSYLGLVTTDVMIGGGVERDRFLSTRAVLVVNECEPLFTPKHEQKVKSSVDQEIVTYRDLYSSSPVSRQRTALIIGTTNKPDLYTGSLGTRKVWQIPVESCDSYLIRDMDKQQLYAEVYHELCEYKKEHPKLPIQGAWSQSVAELDEVDEVNRRAKGTIGLDSLLVEVFGDPVDTVFDPELYRGRRGIKLTRGCAHDLSNRPNAWNLTHLLRYMVERFPDDKIDRTRLGYATQAYAEIYTGTKGKSVELFKKFTSVRRPIKRGVLEEGGGRFYLMPPIGTELTESTDEEME